jgi:hypothetical protein
VHDLPPEKWKETIMKSIRFFSVAAMILGVAGCATPPVVVAPVGPNPVKVESVASMGSLQVFSRMVEESDDLNQGSDGLSDWWRHSEYVVYNLQGKPVKHVENANGHYADAPERVVLPVGKYFVKAQAKDYFWVKVPVTIERGRTTRVHLDDNWKPAPAAPKQDLVTMPNGKPVGWRAGTAKEFGIN